jgi:FtsP/CotA-like multicopper oxidase with cupredoxin domain
MNTRASYFPTETRGLPFAGAPRAYDVEDGSRFELRIAPVVREIGGAAVRLLSYNGSIPGPTLRVRQGTTVVVDVVNDGDLEGTVHWHGLRLDNRYDGTTATQRPVPVGGRFTYRIEVPDPGLYWYHPHIREDYGQEMGLYGNIVVEPADPSYWPAAHREETLVVDDILIENGKVAPFDRAVTTYAAMGRFGNVLLANGEPSASFRAKTGEVIRFYVTNTANTRVFHLAFRSAQMKLVGGDSGRYERETFVDGVILAPSERAVIDVRFPSPGRATIEHRTPRRTYALGTVEVSGEIAPPLPAPFTELRANADMAEARALADRWVDAPPHKSLSFVAVMDLGVPEHGGGVEYYCPMHPDEISTVPGKCSRCRMKLLARETSAVAPHHTTGEDVHAHDDGGIEWEDDMVDVNRLTTTENTRWKLVDGETGQGGANIAWSFRVGDKVKLRLVNTMDSDHPMHHPFHVHGAGRFLVLSRDGVVEPNLVWKDTVLVRTGQTVDILLDITRAGRWMAHCHIAEHHESGMMLMFDVNP